MRNNTAPFGAATIAAVDDVRVGDGLELRYRCDRSALPEHLRARFIELDFDDEAQRFVVESLAAPHGSLRTGLYRMLQRVLSDYDAYGLLGMYPMHLLSTAQLERLLDDHVGGTLLDVGAGDGGITARAAPLFERVAATEASRMLARRLRTRRYRVIDHDLSSAPLPDGERFDAVLCLNVLDRCHRPRTLLSSLVAALQPQGRLLLSVPLPLRPHVHVGARTVDPDEPLPDPKDRWEAGAASLERLLLAPAGLAVEHLSRAPYLCRGDSRTALHVLDAALFTCRRALPG